MTYAEKVLPFVLKDKETNLKLQFVIGKRIFEIGSKDIKIFRREKAASAKIKSKVCILCKESPSDRNFCNFCGHLACEKCMWKTKKIGQNSDLKGNICQICDRKFIIYDLHQDQMKNIFA